MRVTFDGPIHPVIDTSLSVVERRVLCYMHIRGVEYMYMGWKQEGDFA